MLQAKLNSKKASLFKISWVGRLAYKLKDIPKGYYSTFHVLLLEPYHCRPDTPLLIELPPLIKN